MMNLNKLVQPECGGSNPLVAAAQQLAMRPSSSRFQPSYQQPGPSFSAEFMQQQQLLQQKQQQQQQQTIQAQAAQPFLQQQQQQQQPQNQVQQQSTQLIHPNQHQLAHHPQQQQSTHHIASMMAATNISQQPLFIQSTMASNTNTLNGKLAADYLAEHDQVIGKQEGLLGEKQTHDDVEFWQSLAQKYVGPATVSREEMTTNKKYSSPADLEYTFDERNPLKDQFEDPFAEGLLMLEQGDIPSAALLFEAAVQKDPQHAKAWRFLGTTQAQNEQDKLAIKALRNCLNLDNQDQGARFAISVSLANEGQQHEACQYLVEWLMNHEKYRSIQVSLSEFENLHDTTSGASYHGSSADSPQYCYIRDKYVQAARMSPNDPDPEVQSSLGVLFNMSGEYEKAVDCFRAALSVKSDDSLLWNRLGATLANGSKADEAIVAYKKALEISPGFLRCRYNLAISLIHLNFYQEAAKQLVQILNMQAAGKGSKNSQIRTRSITSLSIWNTLRTVATLMNRPELYPIIDGRDLGQCNKKLLEEKPPSTVYGN